MDDLRNGSSTLIQSHGNRVECVAFDPAGTKLITGDTEGVVRVGPINGGTPNLLYGHKYGVRDVVVHPRGEWILSTEFGPTARLWRMPQGKPLHLLPAADFMKVLREATNVRVISDESLAAGYRIELAPFTGWKITKDN